MQDLALNGSALHPVAAPRAPTFGVRAADAADRVIIEQLVAEMIPNCDITARWRWLYEANPAGRALTWIASAHTDEVAGCTSFFPFRLWLDGAEVRAALGGDGYIRPAFRRKGLGALLHDASRRAMAEHDIGCMYGAPGAMNVTPLKHGGSREVGHVARWTRPLRGAAFGLEPHGGRRMRDRAADTAQLALDRIVGAALRPHASGRLEPMLPHDTRVDAVWHDVRRELRLAAVRDSTFYTWRFLDAPERLEPPYVILHHGRPTGACALEASDDGRSVHIIDLVATRANWHACLRTIARYVADTTDARTLDIKLFAPDGRRRAMWRSGFTERQSKPFLCMIPVGGDRRFVDPGRWFYCGGDSDLHSLR